MKISGQSFQHCSNHFHHSNMSKNQIAQKSKLNMAIASANIRHHKSPSQLHWNTWNSMHRAKLTLNTKIHFQIFHALLNHFMWIKAQNAHGVKIYKKHAMVLRNENIEIPTRFEELSWNVIFWLLEVETDALHALKWWMIKVFQLKNARGSLNQLLPLLYA